MKLFDNIIDCCGCGECAAICPKNAIQMKPDEKGFLYPAIDNSLCVNCGLCQKNCSFNNKEEALWPSKALIARTINDEILERSTSGGMYTLISDYILNKGGVVYAPNFDSEMYLRHSRISNSEHRNKSTGSKYVQSECAVYEEMLKNSKSANPIAFFGTPCQINAMKNFLLYQKADCKGIYYVDVVCNGVGSPLVWLEHKKRIERKYKRSLVDYKFRTKNNGLNSNEECAVFSDGTKKMISNHFYKYNPMYHSRLIVRPSCNNCTFCSMDRVSDITIGDFSKEDIVLNFKRTGGVSTVLINTEKGSRLFNEIKKYLQFQELNLDDISQLRLRECGKINLDSDRFYENIKKSNLNYAVFKWLGIKQYVKIILYSCWKHIKI